MFRRSGRNGRSRVGSDEITLDSDAVVTGAAQGGVPCKIMLRTEGRTVDHCFASACFVDFNKYDFCETKPTSILFSINFL